MAKARSEELKAFNTYLEQIRSQLVGCYQELQLKKIPITAETIKNKFLGVDKKEHSLLSLFDYHNEEMKNMLEWGTLKNYYTTRSYFQLYLKESLHVSDIYLSQLNYRFVAGYEKFMKEYKPLDQKKPCGQNTVMKHIERLPIPVLPVIRTFSLRSINVQSPSRMMWFLSRFLSTSKWSCSRQAL
jgi:hypothetical protein